MDIDPEIKMKHSEFRKAMKLSEKLALLQHSVISPDDFFWWWVDNYFKYWRSDMVNPVLAEDESS